MQARQAAKRALWMARYERAINEREDYALNAGRVCWDTATHLFLSGKDARTAALNASNPYL